jgi:hypothetical protein
MPRDSAAMAATAVICQCPVCRRAKAWHTAAMQYLARLGLSEYEQGLVAHLRAGRRRSTYRYSPSEYHRRLIDLLGRNDEEGFKGLRLEQGYASAARA